MNSFLQCSIIFHSFSVQKCKNLKEILPVLALLQNVQKGLSLAGNRGKTVYEIYSNKSALVLFLSAEIIKRNK